MSREIFGELLYAVDQLKVLMQQNNVRWTDVENEAFYLLEKVVAFLQNIPVKKG